MTQEIRATARVRYPSSTIRSHHEAQRRNDYLLASHNLWAKALSVIGVGILLLLAYAIFPEIPIIIIGACVILFGLCLLAFDCMLKNKCKKSAERRHGIRRRAQNQRQHRRVNGISHNSSQTRAETGMPDSTLLTDEIWTSSVTMDWPFPPPTPPPIYSPTDPIASPEVDSEQSGDEEHIDSVTELPIFFPIRRRQRCISTPPLPSYEEVIESDRQEGRLSSSMPTLDHPTSSSCSTSSPSSSIITSSSTATTEVMRMSLISTTTSYEVSSPASSQSRERSVSLPVLDTGENS